MLEYFAYKKMKKHRAEKEAARAAEGNSKGKDKEVSSSPSSPRPSHRATRSSSIPSTQLQSESTLSDGNGERQVLTEREAEYFERLTSEAGSVVDDDEGPPPPLPPRIRTPSLYWESDEDERSHKNGKTSSKDRAGSDREHRDHRKDKKDKDKSGSNRLSVLIRKATKRGSSSRLAVPGSSSDVADADREKHDLNRVLEDLNLSARNNKVISMSKESAVLMQRFTQVFKDLVNGVPTAYNDLVSLFNDGDKILAKSYDKLPSSMKKLVTSLPSKLTNSLAPELLAVAAESQGIKATEVGIKTLLEPQNLQELVAKPGAVVGMLKAIMNALKLRWPAFIGSSVLWSVALFLLMFVLWYCHKRGREVRLEAEAAARAIDGKDRIEELPDDPVLPAPHPIPARDPILTPDREESLTPGHGKPPPRALHGKSVGVSQGRSTPPKKHRDRERD